MASNAGGYDFRAPRPSSTPVGPGDGGGNLEARIAKLEAHVEHIQSDISEIKTDVRTLRDKAEQNQGSNPGRQSMGGTALRRSGRWIALCDGQGL